MKINTELTGTEKIRAMLQRIGAQVSDAALKKTAEDVEEYVGNEVVKHQRGTSDALHRSVYLRRIGDAAYEVGNDLQVAPQALFVHWGTKPHVIKPKKADGFTSTVKAHMRKGHPVKEHTRTGGKAMLRWPVGGKFVFAREVHHPGYKGDEWMVRAAALAPQLFEQHVMKQLGSVVKAGGEGGVS